ncbi:lipoyl(octanoyl) transferase [Neisseria gonorrhoeae]|nr:lipoyl(octanoyl) transferase [Neisseria gonorrhoeae]
MKIIHKGLVEYLPTFEAMKTFNAGRNADTEDELWVVEHPPVFTQGLAGKPEHLLIRDDIPVVQIDRGGQITYHGPGQLVVYTMIDFKRRKTSVRNIVSALENSIIATLAEYGIEAAADPKRPGIYVGERKIASLGLRIKNGSVYHGLALNVNMDLSPFTQINPCGYAGMEMTQIADFVQPCPAPDEVASNSPHTLKHNSHRKQTTMSEIKTDDPKRGIKLRGADKTARIPIKVVPLQEKLKSPNGYAPNSHRANSLKSKTFCANKRCTPFARKPPAPTSANASAKARRPS